MSKHTSPSARRGIRSIKPRTKRNLNKYLLNKYSNICQYCFERIDLTLESPDPMSWTRDHIISMANGGTNSRDNLQPMHLKCNTDKSIEEKRQSENS